MLRNQIITHCDRISPKMNGVLGTDGDGKGLPETYVPGFHDEECILKMKYKRFGKTGMNVSVMSLGCAGLGPGTYRNPDINEAIRTVHAAIKSGINYLDIAPWYGFGTCESILGKALVDIPRKAYYIGTKVGRYRPEVLNMFDFTAAKTLQSVDESLKKMQLDYIDVIQVHDVEFADDLDIIIKETLPALQKLKEVGKVKFIGITGHPPKLLRDLYRASNVRIDSVLSHCHCTLFNTKFNDDIDEYESNNTATINAGILAMGLFTIAGPMHWHPAHQEIKNACLDAINYCKDEGVNISRIATQFSLETFKGTTSLVGCAETDLLQKNLDILYNGITDKERTVLQAIKQKFMDPLQVNDWSEKEVKKYRDDYKAASQRNH